MYLRTPWGMSQLMKTTYKVKLENAKKAVDSLEENIEIRKLMTPGINWQENWIKKVNNETERNAMKEECVRLGYRTKKTQNHFLLDLKNYFLILQNVILRPPFLFIPYGTIIMVLNKH